MGKSQFHMLKSRLAGVEAVCADTAHSFPRHTHDRFGIGMIDRGAQRSLSGRGTVEASAGDVITVNPGEVHDGMPVDDGGRAWRMLYIDCSAISVALADTSEDRMREREFALPATNDLKLRRLFDRLFYSVTSGSGSSALLCEELLLRLVNAAMPEERTSASIGVAGPVGRARDLIDDDPARVVTLADLARECGLSRFQLVRGFAEATGLTPHAYLIQRRIALARRLIADGEALAATAAVCGFADQSHMTRLFVRLYGISPGAYARAVR
jgi:AraC-like DNA-binding protein